MDRLSIDVTEESPDFRSRQVSCRVQVKNLGAGAIEIHGMELRVPPGIRIAAVGDPVALRTAPLAERLCAQLEQLLAVQIGMMARDDFIVSVPSKHGTLVGNVARTVLLGWLVWAMNSWRIVQQRTARIGEADEFAAAFNRGRRATVSGIVPEIHCLADAECAYREFFEPDLLTLEQMQDLSPERALRLEERSAILHKAYLAVMVQLANREGRPLQVARHPLVQRDPASTTENPTGFAVLGSQAETSKAYLLQCQRGFLSSRMYTISAEVAYRLCSPPATLTADPASEVDQPPPALAVHERTLALTISPHPVTVTLVALLGALMGAVLGAALPGLEPGERTLLAKGEAGTDLGPTGWDLLPVIWHQPGIGAAILAIALFNIFEFTSLGANLKNATSWRGGLLIGLLCGLGNEKILSAAQELLS